MKRVENYIPLFIPYLLGINFYFFLWYLGTEGTAPQWSLGEVSFYQLWFSSIISSTLVFIGLAVFRWYSNRYAIIHFRSNRIGSLVQWGLGAVFFLVFVIGVIQLKVSNESVQLLTSTSLFLSLAFYHLSLFLVVVTIFNLNDRLGGLKKVITYLLKTFSAPRQLERGFMFLDLNDSTQIAEQLKSEKYSAFIRHCFRLLDQVVDQYKGIQIYQYVGDEAVLYWHYQDKVICTNAISLFKSFKVLLDHYEDHFIAEYGVRPTFKAAIHGGPVVQSELGRNVIHTAFHGDVLNTSSRILGICHKHDTDLLLSNEYYQRLNPLNLNDNYERIDDVILNGKKHKLTVYKPVKLQLTKELKQILL